MRTGEVMVREGSPETAELFTGFRADMAKFGEKKADLFDAVNEEFGHLMLLAESKFLAESGDAKKVADAMTMVKRINDKHPNDFVGVRAKAVLRDILGVQQSLVSGTLLFEIAKGEFQNKNLETAIKGLRRTIPLFTADEAKKFGLESWQMLGTAYGQSDRYVEAVLAFSEGLKRHAGDDEARRSDTADSLDRAMAALKRQSKNDPFFEPLYASVNELIKVNSTTGGAKLFWKQGNDLFLDKKYAEAIAQLKQVDAKFPYYERALVNIARAHLLQGDFAAARAALAEFRTYAGANELDPKDTLRQQVRAIAATEGEFAETQMAYFEARGNDDLKVKKDLTKYGEAVKRTEAFIANFGKDGANFMPSALEYLGRLHADQAQLDKAEAARVQLKQIDPLRASRLAVDIFKEFQGQVKTLTEELDKAIAGDKGDKVIAKATEDVEVVQKSLVALGLDYIASAPKPQLGVLVATLQTCEQLRQWERVDEIARKSIDLYGSDTTDATKRVIDQVVRPMIGEALLQLRKFEEALTMLKAAEAANPQKLDLKRQIARALGGWFEFDKTGRAVKEPGLDKPIDAYTKYWTEYKVWGLRPEVKKYSLDWYKFHWEAYWFAKQAGAKDEKFKAFAASLYRTAQSTDDFATLKTYGAEGLKLHKYFSTNRN